MDRARSTNGREEDRGYWWGGQKERDHKEDQDKRWVDNIKMDLIDRIGWYGLD
jgi:hypothetical protein